MNGIEKAVSMLRCSCYRGNIPVIHVALCLEMYAEWTKKPSKPGCYKYAVKRVSKLRSWTSTQYEACVTQCPCSLTTLAHERISRSVFVVLTYQSFSELWRHLETLHESFVHLQSVASITLTDNISHSVHLSVRSSICIQSNLMPISSFCSYRIVVPKLCYAYPSRYTKTIFVVGKTPKKKGS
jgi:hypothetical protein